MVSLRIFSAFFYVKRKIHSCVSGKRGWDAAWIWKTIQKFNFSIGWLLLANRSNARTQKSTLKNIKIFLLFIHLKVPKMRIEIENSKYEKKKCSFWYVCMCAIDHAVFLFDFIQWILPAFFAEVQINVFVVGPFLFQKGMKKRFPKYPKELFNNIFDDSTDEKAAFDDEIDNFQYYSLQIIEITFPTNIVTKNISLHFCIGLHIFTIFLWFPVQLWMF